MTFTIPADNSIPEFLRRDMPEGWVSPVVRERKAAKTIPYPKDGYAMKGERKEARAKHRERLRRRAERMRQTRGIKRKRNRK